MKGLMKAVAMGMAVLLVVACGKDKDVDDYKAEQLRKNAGLMQGLAGTYTGVLVSKQANQHLGALQLELKPSTQVVPSTDESKASAQPILIANVEFQGTVHMATVATRTYYDPDTGELQIEIPITPISNNNGSTVAPGTTTTQQTVTINSVVHDNGSLSGTLEARGYTDYGATFSMTKNGTPLMQLAQESNPVQDLLFEKMDYSGTTTFAATSDSPAVTKPVNLSVVRPPSTSDQDFLNLLVPVKDVLATLNYGNGALIPFVTASLDMRTGTLTGQGTLAVLIQPNSGTNTGSASATGATPQSQTTTITLSCKQNAGSQGFDCQHTTSTSGQIVAQTNVGPVAGTASEPPDSPNTRNAVTKLYKGEIEISTSPSKTRPITMTVIYGARTRLQEVTELFVPTAEKLMAVSFEITGGSVPISFPYGKWDDSAKTLDATGTLSVDGSNVPINLSCPNFTFADGDYGFNCEYENAFKNANMKLTLHSK